MDNYIIIDIETSPMSFESFDEAQQEYLLRGTSTDDEVTRKKHEMALTPFTGMVVCIGFIHMTRNDNRELYPEKRVCLMRTIDDSTERSISELPSGGTMVLYSEAAVLSDFWKYIRSVLDNTRRAHFVTFNGRGFDFPFLMLRSAILGVRPTVNLMSGTRWNYRENHTDLMDELTFQMPQQNGATRRFNLDFYTKSFGVQSPKSDGVDGSKVAQLYASSEYVAIAEYCLRDVEATWRLYLQWQELMKF